MHPQDPTTTASPPEPRSWIWLRAVALAPVLIALMGAIAGSGGHPALPMDTLYGGEARGSLALAFLAGYAALGAYGFAALALYALLFVNGFRAALANLGRACVLLAALLLASWVVMEAVRARLEGEIAATGTVREAIDATRWEAQTCGRGRYVCVRWQGSLGRAGVRKYLPADASARAEALAWAERRSAGDALEVSWGRTPGGWIAAQRAQVHGLSAANPWHRARTTARER